MISNIALLILITASYTVNAIPINKFYPFGFENGDTILPKNAKEVVSPEISLRVPIKFYGERYDSLYVSGNGLISFLIALSEFINMQFPLSYPVIAPLYADVDNRGGGQVSYRETFDPSLLARMSDELYQAFRNPTSAYRPTSLFIATWFQLSPSYRVTNKKNTFQVVIASNGNESFVEFMYADDGIQWIQGESIQGTGTEVTIAQAGLTAYDGRSHSLRGSGTDQIRNLARLSNFNEAGLWIFRCGDVGQFSNVEEPDLRQILSQQVTINQGDISCVTAFSLCHSQATCIDSNQKFCCVCRKGFYGNGFNCLKEGVPIRANGKVNLDVNGVKLTQQDIQVYIVPSDGRVYAAISKIPKSIGTLLQVTYPITTMLNWLFAIPTSKGLNGYQITGGILEHSADIIFKDTNNKISMVQKFLGTDIHDQLKIDLQMHGRVPVETWEKLDIDDYQMQFNFIAPGVFKSSSTLVYKIILPVTHEEVEKQIILEQTVRFNESCALDFNSVQTGQNGQYSYYRVKTARTFLSYEGPENILRFAATSKVSLLTENDDPCIEGRIKCVVNSSCVVEGDSFKCLCNPGFQTTYSNRYNEPNSNDFGCLDINECAEGKASCNENAMCVNEIGSYRCACKTGYTGDGYTCTELDSPCGNDFSRCNPPNSYCAIPNDFRTCNCTQGFQKVYIDNRRIGFFCIDIDECQRNVCGPYSVCKNLVGSYQCECKPGYVNDGYQCQKITRNECESNPCGPNSICSNSGDSYTCECLPGYVGNGGRQCYRKSGSCKSERNCSPNGECIFEETLQTHVCRCISGYFGNGYQCYAYGGRSVIPTFCEKSECVCPLNFITYQNWCVYKDYAQVITNNSISCNLISNMCHPHAQCIFNSSTQQHQCVCNPGYDGTGYDCTEVEISCLMRNDICDQHATCIPNNSTPSKASCVCNNHYHGDGLTCSYLGICFNDMDCKPNEECFYNDDTLEYDCRCKKDYMRTSEGYCQSTKQCPVCYPTAKCITNNVTGLNFCECPPGYRGDGITYCEKAPLDCNIDNNCSPFAKCDYNFTTATYECHCKRGFAGNGTYCSIVQTCYEIPEICDRNARCMPIAQLYGNPTIQCQCNPGYIGNGTYCTEIPVHEGGFLFVNWGTATLRIPYEPTIANPGYPIQTAGNQIAIGLTIDCQRNRVFWSDYYGQKIKSASFKGKNIITVVEGNITAPEGLALDWLNQAIYWTDSAKKVIETVNLDGTNRRVVISKNLTNPRGIAIEPYRRKLFWSDWSRAQPKIEWSNVDGTDRSTFISGPDVQLPNSVTIDSSTDELCWADAGTKRIMCIGIENRESRTITSNCVSPFGLTVSTTRYYWTEKSLGKVGYFDKSTRKSGNITLPTTGSGTLYGIVNVPTEC